jgi:cytochrome c oxidase assembly factor CtaG
MTFADTPYTWTFAPQVVLALLLAAAVYIERFRAVQSSAGRHAAGGDHLRALAFGAGLAALFAALISPIDRLGEERLFTVHMVQHLLIADIAPILLLLGLTRPMLRPVVRRLVPIERSLGYVVHPLTALVLMVATVWAWHFPPLYELALENAWAHQLEHLTFFGAGLAFWWYVIEPVPPRHRLTGPWTVAYVAGAKLLLGGLGLVLAFSPNVLYDLYEQAPRTWGLSPLEDLNVGGLVMMLEQMIILAIFFAISFARMLERSEEAERRRERLEGLR